MASVEVRDGLALHRLGEGEPILLMPGPHRFQRVGTRSADALIDGLRGIAPTLILCGLRDPQYPPACSRELAAAIPGARAVYFERSGHYPFIEEAGPFWVVVAEFLGG